MAYTAGSLVVDILANDQVSTTLDKIQNKIGAFGTKSTRLAKNGGGFGFLKIAKWTAVFAVARRFGRVLGNIVQAGADYTETLNLWETAMGSNLNVATEFVNKMNEAYGISEKTLMNAQAIFKNMLGSLGQISDTMAYSLSEGITQMALDYASLYNQTFEQAFTKFQAALAGQVRPIRSVSGYDITENTLYQLYQSLGGTKTMRQLTRTEKQLLSILAIFNQMTASGAIGDLDKTMESFANQSRVMAESWQQVKTYAGALITYTIQESGLLTYINAILMFIGDTLKAVAESVGAIQHFGGDIFENTTESALGASEAIDEVQGKLLDFDKFRAMSGGEENALGLDEKLLQALSGYDTILGNASMKARELADSWKEITFWANGVFDVKKWNNFVSKLKETLKIVKAIAITIIAYKMVNFIGNITTGLGKLKGAFNPKTIGLTALVSALMYAYVTNENFRNSIDNLVNTFAKPFGELVNAITPILTTIIDLVAEFVVLLDKTELLEIAIITLISYRIYNRITKIASGFVNLVDKVGTFATNLLKQSGLIETKLPLATKSITGMQLATSALTGVLGFLVGDMILSNLGEDARKIVAPIMLAVGAITSLVMAMLALRGVMSWGTALPIITAGIGVAIAGVKGMLQVDNYADGGLPDKGTLFRAGEAGAEIVYNTPSGQSGVVNVQQIQSAFNGALNNWWSNAKHDIPQFKEVSKTGIYEVAKSEMRRRGEW